MASWKKVLTSDDVTNLNLGNTDLTMSDVDVRKFTIGTQGESSRILRFDGDYVTTAVNLPLLELQRDDSGLHRVFAGAVNGLFIGMSNASSGDKWKLPSYNTCGAGKVIVGTGDEESQFYTLDEWLDPDYSGGGFSHSTDFDASGSQPRSDKVLIWDDSDSKYRPASLQELSKALGRPYTFTYGRGQSVATSGTVAMRTTNGAEGTGYVTPYNSRITGVTYAGRFFNTDGTGTVKVQLKIDGTATWTSDGGQNYQSYQFAYLQDYGDDTHASVQMFGTPIVVDAGTRIDVVVGFSGDTGGDVDDQSVVVLLDYYDSHASPLTV